MADADNDTVGDGFGSMAIFVTACSAVLCMGGMALCAYRCTACPRPPPQATASNSAEPYLAPKYVQPPPPRRPSAVFAVVDHPDGQRALAMTRPRVDKKMYATPQSSTAAWVEV